MSIDLDRPPRRFRLSRSKGWRMPPNARSVARPTVFGNPYRVGHTPPLWPGDPLTAQDAVDCYRLMLAGGWRLRLPPGFTIVERAMAELPGLDLGCWCSLDQPCHADVLLEYANAIVTPSGEVLPFDASYVEDEW